MSKHVKVDNERKKPPPRSQFPTSSLMTQENYGKRGSVKCAYCGQLHFSASCEVVVVPNERKEILKRDNRFFVCLQRGHRSNQCDVTKKCRRCEGKHHQFLCERSSPRTADLKTLSRESKSPTVNEPKREAPEPSIQNSSEIIRKV